MRQFRVHYGADRFGFYWPESEQKRAEWLSVKRNRPSEAQSVYQCRPGEREGTIFLAADFAYYTAPSDLECGIESPGVKAFVAGGHMVAVGWDTAFEATSSADHTAGLAALFVPCSRYHRGEDPAAFGECEPHFDVLFLDMVHERLAWADLVPKFRLMHRKWEPYVHVVEKRGTGISLYQTMRLSGINIVGETPTESKRARAIQGVGAGSVQGWFRQHRVRFPVVDGMPPAWVRRAKTQLEDFTGAKDASDDIVDAVVHLVTYAIRQGAGAAILPDAAEIAYAETSMLAPSDDPRLQFLTWLGAAPSFSEDPYEHTCARCSNWVNGFCRVYKRMTISMDGIDCMEFDGNG